MHISAKPLRATLIQNSNGECLLHFTCTALDDFGVLEIGTKYVFAGNKHLRMFGRRSTCELVVRVRRSSALKEVAIATLKLSTDKVGELSFCPSTKGGTLETASKASLDATIFVDD